MRLIPYRVSLVKLDGNPINGKQQFIVMRTGIDTNQVRYYLATSSPNPNWCVQQADATSYDREGGGKIVEMLRERYNPKRIHEGWSIILPVFNPANGNKLGEAEARCFVNHKGNHLFSAEYRETTQDGIEAYDIPLREDANELAIVMLCVEIWIRTNITKI